MKGIQGLEIISEVERVALLEPTDSFPAFMPNDSQLPETLGPQGADSPELPCLHLHLCAHTHMESHINIRENKIIKLKDSLIVKSTCCFCRECRFNSQSPHGGFTTICNSISRNPVPSSEFHWHQECSWCTYAGKTFILINKSLKFLNK